MLKHPTKIVGLLMVVFGAAQAMSGQLQELLSPMAYMWVTIVLGVVVGILGALKKGSGGVLAANRTTITGALLVGLGILQGYSDTIRGLLDPTSFTVFSFVVGILIAVLGFLNTSTDPEPTE